jgi:LuxR family maltose regulon positive regulatory protein
MFGLRSAMRLTVDRSRRSSFPWLGVQNAVLLAQTLLELDDLPTAQQLLREAWHHLGRLSTAGVLRDQVLRLEEAVDLRHGTPGSPGVVTLTDAERRVLDLLPTHLTLAGISSELGLSRNTVKTQAAAIYRKVGAPSRAEAVRRSRELGLLGS